MIYTFQPKGVCPNEIIIEYDENNVIQKITANGGCSGNLQGISALARGMSIQDAINHMKGIRCSFKQTSCPDQIAAALEKIMEDYSSASSCTV